MEWDGKPWRGLSGELKQRFGTKVIKLSLDGGFTCPNRDGTVGVGGCAFCGPDGSGGFSGQAAKSITEQLSDQRMALAKKWPSARYIAYFQAFSGTYGTARQLEALYQEALRFPGVVGLAIATRPDCISPEGYRLLAALNRQTFLWVELGLQTIHDATARAFGRGYDYACFLKTAAELKRLGIPFVVHLINGLPGEGPEEMRVSAMAIGQLRPWGIKLHLLHVIEGTQLAERWRAGNYHPLEKDEYITLVAEQLEQLPPETVIHRLTGDGSKSTLLAPRWSLDKKGVLGAIEGRMRGLGSWQGSGFKSK